MLYTGIKNITDADMRQRTIDSLIALRRQLDEEIPKKTAASSLLLATWNIRAFSKNSRTKESLYYIAEILSRFDLVAIQEVKSSQGELERVMAILGRNWDYIATDVTEGGPGNGECIAFLYDTNKVSFKNMAGEIVLPKDKLIDELQFARTPFCVSYQAGWFKFNIATVHIVYGEDNKAGKEKRRKEIAALTEFLAKRADDEETNYVVLGDFNIPKVGDEMMKALEANGFHIPGPIKEHPTDLGETKHYDQIAFNLHMNDTMQIFDEKVQHSGAFNFTKSVYREEDYEAYIPLMKDKEAKVKDEATGKNKTVKVKRTGQEAQDYFMKSHRTFQMSDHLPLWVELKVDFSGQYLDELKAKYAKK